MEKKLQPFLIFAFSTMNDPIRTLAVLYFSIFNNIRPQAYLILAFEKDQDHSHNFFTGYLLKKLKPQEYFTFAFSME